MIENFDTKLSEITELHKKIQIQLSESAISADMRIKLSKKFSSLEQVLACKESIEKCDLLVFCVPHKQFKNIDKKTIEKKKILD